MNFQNWWVYYRGFDDPNGKGSAYAAFQAGVDCEKNRCKYPDCLENEDERCSRWLAGECERAQK